MIPLAENPYVSDPAGNLTRAQRQALLAANAFKHHRKVGGAWQLGVTRFAVSTVNGVIKAGLLKQTATGLLPTTAGALALEKLKREQA